MHKTLMAALTTLSLYSPLLLATTYSVDPSQSYITTSVPGWERGEPWGFFDPEGNEISGGYVWRTVTLFEKFTLGGVLNLSEVPNTNNFPWPTVVLDSEQLVSTAPEGLTPKLPSFLAFDSGTDTFRTCARWCATSGNHWYWEDLASAVMHLNSNTLILDGSRNSTFNWLNSEFFGGYEAPPSPEFSYNNANYSYRIVAYVPEPDTTPLLLSGIAVLVLSSCYRKRH